MCDNDKMMHAGYAGGHLSVVGVDDQPKRPDSSLLGSGGPGVTTPATDTRDDHLVMVMVMMVMVMVMMVIISAINDQLYETLGNTNPVPSVCS